MMRILQTNPASKALEAGCMILVFTWPFGRLLLGGPWALVIKYVYLITGLITLLVNGLSSTRPARETISLVISPAICSY